MARHLQRGDHLLHELLHRDNAARATAAQITPPPVLQAQPAQQLILPTEKPLLPRGGFSVQGEDPTPASDGGPGSSAAASGTSSASSSSSSASNHHAVNISVPVALGLIIPLAIALVIFFFLHRRHVKRMRREDANDPHKSLDFGWDPTAKAPPKKGRSQKRQPQTTVRELGLEKGMPRRERGMSMDIDMGSPYLLPPGLQHSHESLHSMSRTIHSQDDRYRPATTYIPNDGASLRSHSRTPVNDDASMRSGRRGLGRNSKRMSSLYQAPTQSSIPEIETPPPAQIQDQPRKPLPHTPASPPPAMLSPSMPSLDARDSYTPGDDLRKSNNYLGAFIHSRDPSVDTRSANTTSPPPNSLSPPPNARSPPPNTRTPPPNSMSPPLNTRSPPPSTMSPPPITRTSPPREERHERQTSDPNKDLPAVPQVTMQQTDNRKSPPPAITAPAAFAPPPRQQSLHSAQEASFEHTYYDEGNDYGDAIRITPASPHQYPADEYANNRGSSQEYMPHLEEFDLGLTEADFAYDVRRVSGMGIRPLPPDDPNDNPEQRANRIRSFYKEYFDDSKPGPAEYYEDYDEGYLDDGVIWDPISEQYVTSAGPMPYAEPYGRRAMTPPPRVGGRRHAATMSGGYGYGPPGPRPYSSASNRMGPRRPPPTKRLPPPKPLRALPTPHLLKEDAFALPIDFAPPTYAKDRRAGRPESPRGGVRPYAPAVRAHTPLASSFDDLAVMPSPHELRKSGTFTALDFAPPPKFKDSDTGSDAGSIRSNRTGMSARSQHALRAGAYRLSRMPKEMVGTKGDLMSALKPSWNMHNNSGTAFT